jgi:hypothetical protein
MAGDGDCHEHWFFRFHEVAFCVLGERATRGVQRRWLVLLFYVSVAVPEVTAEKWVTDVAVAVESCSTLVGCCANGSSEVFCVILGIVKWLDSLLRCRNPSLRESAAVYPPRKRTRRGWEQGPPTWQRLYRPRPPV